MKLELEIDDNLLTEKNLEELKNLLAAKLIQVKAGLDKPNIQDALCSILYTKIMEIKGGGGNE